MWLTQVYSCSSQWDVLLATWRRASTPPELEQEHQSIWLQCWSTYLLRFWSWQAMLPKTTRRPGLYPGTFNLQSGMMRSWASCLARSPSHLVVFCQTFMLSSCPRRPRRRQSKFCHNHTTPGDFNHHHFEPRIIKCCISVFLKCIIWTSVLVTLFGEMWSMWTDKLLGKVTIAPGDVLPNMHAVLLPKKEEE